MSPEVRVRVELVAAGERLYRAGLVRAGEGNFSARIDEDWFVLTPRGQAKGYLNPWELVRAPLEGELPPEASSEGLLHQGVLRAYPHIRAVLHAHPPHILRCLIAGVALDPAALKEAVSLRVAVLPDASPGSRELAEVAVAALAHSNVLLLPGHGAVAVGSSVGEALVRLETAELLAQVCLGGTLHA